MNIATRIPSDNALSVYCKTDKGRQALADGERWLRLRHRQLLVLVDGKRSIGALADMLRGLEVAPVVDDLYREGFIEPAASRTVGRPAPAASATPGAQPAPSAAPVAPSAEPPAPAAQLDPQRLHAAKSLMLDIARRYLGLLADKLADEIASAHTPDQFRKAMAHWNMALRESARGSVMASQHLDEVRALMDRAG